ncbi:MAG: cell wall hydrolase [Brevundimonas sp.]
MTRTTAVAVACLATLMMTAAPALAQSARPAAETQSTAPAAPAPGSDDWLRQRGESYHSAPESAQDPAEVSATAKLNESIAARNAAAEQAEAAEQARFNSENQRWQDDAARSSTARVQWEADVAAANAAQARWERERAAYDAEVAACRASGRTCITPGPSPK